MAILDHGDEWMPGTTMARQQPGHEVGLLPSGKRVSNTERDAVASGLAGAHAKGYIDSDTYEARYTAAMAASSEHELARLTADLPVRPPTLPVMARHFAGWVTALLASLFVMVPVPVLIDGATGQNWCSGSGASEYCWTTHGAPSLALQWGCVFTGLVGVVLTVLLFIASHASKDD